MHKTCMGRKTGGNISENKGHETSRSKKDVQTNCLVLRALSCIAGFLVRLGRIVQSCGFPAMDSKIRGIEESKV